MSEAVERLVSSFLERHPGDAARVLESLEPAGAADVLESVPPVTAGRVLMAMIPGAVHQRFEALGPERSRTILEALSVDGTSGLLVRMPPDEREPLLAALSEDQATEIRQRLSFPAGTAGSVMESATNVVPVDITAGKAAAMLADPKFPYVYAVDGENRLVGVLAARQVRSPDVADRLVRELMITSPVALPSYTALEVARMHPAWSRVDALPVIDDDRRLIGVLRHKRLRRLDPRMDRPPARVEPERFDALVGLEEAYCSNLWELLAAVTSMKAAGPVDDGPGRMDA